MKKLWLLFVIMGVIIGLVVCQKPPETGWIAVKSEPQGADVYLDDSLTDQQTNCILADVVPGEHVVGIVLDGYVDHEDTVVVEAGDTVLVSAVFSNTEGELLWRFKTDEAVYDEVISSPAIGLDGAIYFGSNNGYFYALNPDGTLKWKSYITGWGIIATPAVGSNGTIYFAVDDEDEDEYDFCVYALNPDGNLKWKFPTQDWFESCVALAADGTIYCTRWNHDNVDLLALNPEGELKWQYPAAWGDPSVGANGTIYSPGEVGIEGDYYEVLAINPEGTIRWRKETGLAEPSSFAIGADGTIYFTTNFQTVRGFDGNSGDYKWYYEFEGHTDLPPVIDAEGKLYFGTSEGDLYVLNENGGLEWKFQTGMPIKSSPAIGSDGVIYVGVGSLLLALNPDSTFRWSYLTGGQINSSPAISPEGVIYFGSNDGYLYALKTSSRGFASSPWPKYRHDNQNTGRAQ